MNSNKIITIGSSLVDIFVTSPEFKMKQAQDGLLICQMYGDKIEIDDLELLTGGGASNTAVGFARMGFDTAVISELGQDVWATEIEQEFRKEKVSTDLLIKEKTEKTGKSVILVGPDGGRTILVHRGASSMLDPEDIQAKAFDKCNWVHITSLGKLDTLLKIFKILQEKQVKYSWTPGKNDLELLANGKLSPDSVHAEVMLLNKEEWQSIESVQDSLQDTVHYVVVTDGRNGGRVLCKRECIHTYTLPASGKPVEETGAGDAFAVGFVAHILRDDPIEKCVEAGMKNAASVVKHIGAKKGLLSNIE